MSDCLDWDEVNFEFISHIRDQEKKPWDRLYEEGKIFQTTRNAVDRLSRCVDLAIPHIADLGLRDYVVEEDHIVNGRNFKGVRIYGSLLEKVLREALFEAPDPSWDIDELNFMTKDELQKVMMASLERRIVELNSSRCREKRMNAFVRKYLPDLFPHIKFSFDEGNDEFQDWLEESSKYCCQR
ncbi:MAG: hypothetical protein AAF702_28125 [Chloroflexota bacterium]